jgi:hypothetical protein
MEARRRPGVHPSPIGDAPGILTSPDKAILGRETLRNRPAGNGVHEEVQP